MQRWPDLHGESVSLRRATMGQRLTSRVGGAPKDDGSVLVLLRAEDVVEADGEAVQVADVQRTKVVMEGIVQEGVVDGEVARGCAGTGQGRCIGGARRPFPGRWGRWLGGWKQGFGRGRVDVGGEIEPVWRWSRSGRRRDGRRWTEAYRGCTR